MTSPLQGDCTGVRENLDASTMVAQTSAATARRLVVVSNRVAMPKGAKPGGLAMAMLGALRESGGIWFGWNGEIVADGCRSVHHQQHGNVEYVTVGLSQQDHDDYYAGFANRTLWPLFHFRPGLVDVCKSSFAGYMRVNASMADQLCALLRPDDLVWVHDYHLIPLAAMLRERGVRCRIGFFLHTPLPPRELLVMLPMHQQLFESLTAYDVVGFHTEDYARAFRDYVVAELGATCNGQDMFSVRGGRASFRIGVFPISIETRRVEQQAARAIQSPTVQSLRASLEGRALVLGVDRLDYSKGLPERFKAYSALLSASAEFRRKVTYLQIAPTSRGVVEEYRALRKDLERIAGGINGQHADADWMPIRYVNKSYQHSALTGFYRLARVGLVTPLRDGMNLVAKEYVASQDPEDPGVLVLSRFAGAAAEMQDALLVNPYDIEGMTASLRAALVMPLHERRSRWESMMALLRVHDIDAWRIAFLRTLEGGSHGQPTDSGRQITPTLSAAL